MRTDLNDKNKKVWLIVIVLSLCVVISIIIFTKRLDFFFMDDSGAISLIPEEEGGRESLNSDTTLSGGDGTSSTGSAHQGMITQPDFEVSDERQTWSTQTAVDIFRMSYENGEHVVTVKSDSGDKVIAPGVENSYTFKLKNTGDVALDYTMKMYVSILPEDIQIPIDARISRYDGRWISGQDEGFLPILSLNEIKDTATLGSGKFTYYTLEWMWPFENGQDDFDTMLGNLAAQEDLTVTVCIETTALESGDPGNAGGIMTPKTGDSAQVILWIVLLIVAGVLVLLFLCKKIRFSFKKMKGGVRLLILTLCGLMLGIKVYLANANSLVGNRLPMPFGYGMAVVLSGSMEPTFSEGTLLLVKEADGYCVNDIVVYQDGMSLVVHRIVEIDEENIVTKGDANTAEDAPIHETAIKGKVLGWIPYAGTVVKGLKSPAGTIGIILLAIVLIEIPNRRQRRSDDQDRQKLIDEIERLKKEV